MYVCVTCFNRWGKGLTIKEAKKNAQCRPTTPEHTVIGFVFNEFESPADQKNILSCLTVDQIDGAPMFYTHNRTKEDTDMILKYFIGFFEAENKREKKK